MKIVNLRDVKIETYASPQGKFACSDQELSIALGRDPHSHDQRLRHPFDVAITTVPAGKANCPFHSHSAQWEFYHILSGSGRVRHDAGESPIRAGDFFLFKPGEAHQLIADPASDLTFSVVADNPVGESCHYPDSQKWLVRSPHPALIRSASLDYHDGEE